MIAAVALFSGFALPGRAPAGGIPVIYGYGDTITFVADLPADSPARPKGPSMFGPGPTRLGYKHWHFHIFWLPVWTSTSAGEFVAYHGNSPLGGTRYLPLGKDPKKVAKNTGVPEAQVTIPWAARHPWGIYVFLVGFLLFVVGATLWAIATDAAARRARARLGMNAHGEIAWASLILQDARYQKALRIVEMLLAKPAKDVSAGPSQETNGVTSRAAFEAGVEHLVTAGVAREEAECKLAFLLQARARAPEEHRDSSGQLP
jgi:hypothetical protein